MADIRLASHVYLPCLRLHVLRAYCTFASKQAVSITLPGLRPNDYPFHGTVENFSACCNTSRSLRTADAFSVVASLPPKEKGREATTGNASAVRRLYFAWH